MTGLALPLSSQEMGSGDEVILNRSEFPADSTLAFRFCARLPYEDIVAVIDLLSARVNAIALA